MTRTPIAAALAAGLLALPARGQDRAVAEDAGRPSEADLFGAPAAPSPGPSSPPAAQPPAPRPPAPGAGTPREAEEQLFGSKGSPAAQQPPPQGLIPREREDWLKMGGQLYLRLAASAYEDVAPSGWPLSSPNLLDLYLDARPNDRVRAFVLGRMNYDPTLSSTSSGTLGGSSGSGTSLSGLTTSSTANPDGVLDQLWINFDLDHTAFVTAGRQHVKWGVGKFWNPTDFLHPVKRDPLAVLDTRTGTTMVKLHLPWEKRGWNFYGVALLEDAAGEASRTSSRVGRVGGGGRAELVQGSAELGLDALTQEGHHPRFGVDLSAGLGDFDLYAEAALRSGTDGSRWKQVGPVSPGPLAALTGWVRDDPRGFTPQVVAGGSWSANYSDQDAVTLGAEYFYNAAGYDGRSAYPFLLLGAPSFDPSTGAITAQQDATAFHSFYLGRHYAGAYVSLPKPGSWNDTTFTLSVLGNLSDRSFVVRLDHSVLVLTYLTVETYLAGHLGRQGGEFRLAVPASVGVLAGSEAGSTFVPTTAPIIDAGIALRVSL